METETKRCPKCGKTAYHNIGISKKTGEPYENWKCPCGYLEWVDVKKPIEQINKEPNWDNIRAEKREKNIDWLNARILAKEILVAAYQKGDITDYLIIIERLPEITKQIYDIKNPEIISENSQ